MQEEVDMIPLMVQQNYKARGWLGLILGCGGNKALFRFATFSLQ